MRNTISICMMPFGEVQNKVMRGYAQSRQYHTIVEIRDSKHLPRANGVNETCLLLRIIGSESHMGSFSGRS